MQKARWSKRGGFTLIETVVTVGIVATLAAVVVPQVVKQFDAADPTKAAEDLNSIRTAIEVFGVNVRPQQPGDIEDLVNRIETAAGTDSTMRGARYSATENTSWNGPYLGLSIPASAVGETVVLTTGFGATIRNGLTRFDVDAATLVGGDTTNFAGIAAADFVAVRISGLSGTAFNALNATIDGPTETTVTARRTQGRLRCPYATVPADDAPCPVAYYLASPLR